MTQPLIGSFRKGVETLKKKAEELSALCETTVGMVIISPKGGTDIWPEWLVAVKCLFNEEKISRLDDVHDKSVYDGSSYYQTRLHGSTDIDFDEMDVDEILYILRFKLRVIKRKIPLFQRNECGVSVNN